jgi:hypothetical protein
VKKNFIDFLGHVWWGKRVLESKELISASTFFLWINPDPIIQINHIRHEKIIDIQVNRDTYVYPFDDPADESESEPYHWR